MQERKVLGPGRPSSKSIERSGVNGDFLFLQRKSGVEEGVSIIVSEVLSHLIQATIYWCRLRLASQRLRSRSYHGHPRLLDLWARTVFA